MASRQPISQDEWQKLVKRIHRALIFGDYRLVGEILATYGIEMSDEELAAFIKMGGTWKEVA